LSEAKTIFAAMHIVIDAKHIKVSKSEEDHHTLALFYKLILSRPEYRFTIISEQVGLLPVLPNATEHIDTTTINGYLQLRRWYKKLLPEIVQQTKAGVLISINGSGKTSLPHIVFLSSLTAVEKNDAGKFLSLFYKKYLIQQIGKASAIATFTPLQQSELAKQLNVKTEQITPVGYSVPAMFQPISWVQKEAVLEEHTNGSEFFLYVGSFSENNFLLLLKAFSLFKKRQLSSMQLIAAGSFTLHKSLAEKIVTYKYRSDVKLYENVDWQKLASILPAAYAVIYLNKQDVTAFMVATALQCEVPVIGLENSAAQTIATSAGLFASATPESLAEQMKLLYKDENLRKQLIANAIVQKPLVNGDEAVQKLWDCIDMAT
jgi:glycosyltransferase involved in cell wall biosynthesis